MAADNAMGENLPIFEIRESTKPRCFSGEKFVLLLSCTKHSWIDWDLFTKLMKEVDRKFTSQDRKIALIIDNCSAHPKVDGLKALELIFLPPNTKSKTQPMLSEV